MIFLAKVHFCNLILNMLIQIVHLEAQKLGVFFSKSIIILLRVFSLKFRGFLCILEGGLCGYRMVLSGGGSHMALTWLTPKITSKRLFISSIPPWGGGCA
jgi:hypothetical protein